MIQPDVFISHTWAAADLAGARTLRDALVRREVTVWFDETEIETFEGLSEQVATGLARAKVFVPWYSEHYPTRISFWASGPAIPLVPQPQSSESPTRFAVECHS
jgi:hypothetical protein